CGRLRSRPAELDLLHLDELRHEGREDLGGPRLLHRRRDRHERREVHHDVEGLAVGGQLGADAEHVVASAADLAQQSHERAFRLLQPDVQRVAHLLWSPITISALDFAGGTSGQTFSACSIDTWASSGPRSLRSRSIARGTSLRSRRKNAGMPNASARRTKSGLSDRSISLYFFAKNSSCHWRTMPSA